MQRIGKSLFTASRLSHYLDGRFSSLIKEIESIDTNRLLNTSVTEMVDYLNDKYKVEPLSLDEGNIAVDQIEKEFIINNFGEKYRKKGTSNMFYVPFSGDSNLFNFRANTSNSLTPIANVTNNELVLTFDTTDHKAERVKKGFSKELENIKRYIEWTNNEVTRFNRSLADSTKKIVEDRRDKILANKNLVSSLGFPLRKRKGALQTYSAPEVRRKPPIRMPTASSDPYIPEPELAEKEYENILSIINNMVQVMERSPKSFCNMKEEDLRQHFLVQLNGQYEGQATGETFNFEGKTDILIRSKGKNIFIGECKFWRGAKSFTSTIDQILGYSTWRDTKTALIIFNKNKDFSLVLKQIPDLIKNHPNFIRIKEYSSETSWRAIFSHRDDKNREITLTVLVYEVPS